MPPKGYRTLTVRVDVLELLSRAKSLFHKSQIQILHEAISEYINRHYEYGSTVLTLGVGNAEAAAWSAGVFDAVGVTYHHPSPSEDIVVEVSSVDKQLLRGLNDIWGGTLYQTREGREEVENRTLWTWRLRARKAEQFLQAIFPYLKGAKTVMAKESLAQQGTKVSKSTLSEAEIDTRQRTPNDDPSVQPGAE